MIYDRNILDELQEIQDTIQAKTDEIAESKAAQEEVVRIQQEKVDSMEVVVKEKQALVASYQNDVKKYEQIFFQSEQRLCYKKKPDYRQNRISQRI